MQVSDWDAAGEWHGALKQLLLSMEAHEPSRGVSVVGRAWQSTRSLLYATNEPIAALRAAIAGAARDYLRAMRGHPQYGYAKTGMLPDVADLRLVLHGGWANVLHAGGSNTWHSHDVAQSFCFTCDGEPGSVAATCTNLTRTYCRGYEDVAPDEELGETARSDAPVVSGVFYVVGSDDAPIEFEDPRSCSRASPNVKWFQQGAIQIAPSRTGSFVLFPSWLRHRVREHTGAAPRISVSFNLAVPNILDVTRELAPDQRRKELLQGGRLRMHGDDVVGVDGSGDFEV